jgi:exonuclease III
MELAANVSIATFNMHGFKQGAPCLTELLGAHDVICIQEHWLMPNDLERLNICSNFIVFAVSSMDRVIEKSILRGRPFGGLAIFINKRFANNIKLIDSSDRFLMITIYDLLVCNVYLPSKSTRDYDSIYKDTLNTIISKSNSLAIVNKIICGDFNVAFNTESKMKGYVDAFCDELMLSRSDSLFSNRNAVSFCTADGSASSLIDHFLVSKDLLNNILDIYIMDCGLNLSDHSPVILDIMIFLKGLNNNCVNNDHLNDEQFFSLKYRWDKANLNYYYNSTFNLLNAQQELIDKCYAPDGNIACAAIEHGYKVIVDALNSAAHSTVPLLKTNHFKHFWDDELESAKWNSIHAHREWNINGKPKAGLIYNNMLKCRLSYKCLINQKEAMSKNLFSNDLAEALQQKRGNDFWNCWNSKFKKNAILK